MQNKKIKVSIISVNYKVEKELIACIDSIQKSKIKESYEIIVVDNDEKKTVDINLKKKFPEVKYIPAKKNLGYGRGNNLGVSHSQGEFLFFLNPDTLVKKNAIDRLVEFLETHDRVGIVAPIFLDPRGKIYPSQGSEELTPLSAIFSLSFINKLMPNNPISKRYFLSNWDKKEERRVGNVPGTAFLIKKSLFKKVGGFDENFFLFFEEFDLCKRVRKLGYDLFILPSAQIIHFWGVSTDKSSLDIKKIFLESKFYYFKKHYGLLAAILVRLITGFNRTHLLIGLIILLSAFLRFYNLNDLMPFIGDQGWFYLSARDMILTRNIPLVGIASSHPWIHQGPLWTYMIAICLWLGNFHPVSGSYFTSILGVITVWALYKISSKLFSVRTGLIAAALYATSPLVVLNSRMAYHTSPIPLFTLLFIWSLIGWVKGGIIFFPLTIFFLFVLYNLELATSALWFVFGSILGYGLWKKKKWVKDIFSKRIIFLSLVGFFVPMFPILIYDFQHGFPQTIKFAAWIGYRILGFLGVVDTGTSFVEKSFDMINFFANQYIFLVFYQNGLVAFVIFILTVGWIAKTTYGSIVESRFMVGNMILLLWTIVPITIFFVNKTPSEAYMPVIFPAVILITALSFESLMRTKVLRVIAITLIAFVVLANTYTLLSNKYFSIPTFSERIIAVEKILDYTNGKKYNMVGEGPGSEFKSFTMNYEYLTWWLGHGPAKNNINTTVVITESKSGVDIKIVEK